jgi:hypothetical protein
MALNEAKSDELQFVVRLHSRDFDQLKFVQPPRVHPSLNAIALDGSLFFACGEFPERFFSVPALGHSAMAQKLRYTAIPT